jgi:hypothetical protein
MSIRNRAISDVHTILYSPEIGNSQDGYPVKEEENDKK